MKQKSNNFFFKNKNKYFELKIIHTFDYKIKELY